MRGAAFIAVHELYDFIATHKLFDKISTNVANYSGLITERVGGLGGTACGTIPVAMEHSYLVPYPRSIADETQHIFAVSGSLAAFGQSLREVIDQATTFGDADTADLFTKVSHGIDHQLWFVESHMAPKSEQNRSLSDSASKPR